MPTKQDENRTELTQEIGELRGKIREAEQSARVKREAAEQLKSQVKAAGHNPITGTSADDKDAFKRVDEAYKESDDLFELAAEYKRRMTRLIDHASSDALSEGDDDDPERPAATRAVRIRYGDRFVASESYKMLKKSGALEMSQASVKTAPVQVATREEALRNLFQAALLDGGPVVEPDQQLFPPVEFPTRALRVRDLVFVTETDSDTVDYVEETTRTDAAAETAYGTAAPEATYVYTPRQASVRRIPQSIPATKGNLADQGQLRGLIDGRLMYGVGKRVDGQMISGDGVGENLRGVLNTAGIGSVQRNIEDVGPPQINEIFADVLHRALTVVRIAFEDEPDAFVIHPTDHEGFILDKASDGHYISRVDPSASQPTTIWGKSTVVSTVVAANTAITGAWRQGATLWVRSGVSVAASDSHEDFFTRGLVMLLAEMRAAFAVTQPKAFCEINFVPA